MADAAAAAVALFVTVVGSEDGAMDVEQVRGAWHTTSFARHVACARPIAFYTTTV